VQTSGYADAFVFEKVLEECDYMLFDLKLSDTVKHKKDIGATNEPILENLRRLAYSGKEFVVRMPLIPGVTDTEENVRGIAEILLDNGIKYIEVLPYNKLAGAKYPLVGRKYDPDFDTEAEPRVPADIFREYGIIAVKM
jgi:pyruvate formate lyase activating enzyme